MTGFRLEILHNVNVSSVHHIRRHMMSIYSLTGGGNIDNLVKRVSVRFLQGKDTFYSL